MQFTVELQDDHLIRILEAARLGVASTQELLGSIGESLLRVNQERHDQGLAPDGSTWEPLAPSTIAAGKRKGGPLNKTGRMLAAIHWQVIGDELRLGFDGSRDGMLAAIHHRGTSPYTISAVKARALKIGSNLYRKRVRHPGLPARPLLGLPDSDIQLVTDVLDDHLTAVLNRVR